MLTREQRKHLRELVRTADVILADSGADPDLLARWRVLRPQLDPDHLARLSASDRREVMHETRALSAALRWEAHETETLRERGLTQVEIDLLDPTSATPP